MVEIAVSEFENEQNEGNTNRALCMQVLSVQTKYDYIASKFIIMLLNIIHPHKYLLFLSCFTNKI